MSSRPVESPASTFTIRAILSRVHLRLVLLSVALAAAGLTVSGVFLLRSYERLSLRQAASAVAYSAEPAVVFGDKDAVAEAVASIRTVESVSSISVRSAEGDLAVDWYRPMEEQGALTTVVSRNLFASPVVAPIYHDGKQIGQVFVRGSAAKLLSFLGIATLISLFCFGLAFFATWLLSRRLQQQVVRPLEQIAAVADAVRDRRDFSRRLGQYGIAEIDSFTSEFNKLLIELQGWHATIARENETLIHRAEHDALTGVGNWSRFERVLGETIELAELDKSTFAVLFLDLDKFKDINDKYGHQVGDLVLRDTARRLKASVRGRDKVFRLGGDEFSVIVDTSLDKVNPFEISHRISEAMDRPVQTEEGQEVYFSLSIGVATYPQDGRSVDELLRRADAMMYQKKGRALRDGD